MLINRLLNFIRGFVVIDIENSNYEKTLNLLLKKNIELWDVQRTTKGIRTKMSYRDYQDNTDTLNNLKLDLIKKTGLSFKYNKLKYRKGFAAGIILIIFCLIIFINLIWKIEVIGAEATLSKQIVKVLGENDINIPVAASMIDDKQIEKILYKNFENLKFVEAYIEGSKLLIFVKEKENEEPKLRKTDPSSIISVKNAIINKIIAKSGQAVVKMGDVVYEGQTLIMGLIKSKTSEELMMVPSDGSVYGKTYYNFQMKTEKIKNIVISTNNTKTSYYLKINGKNIKIMGDTTPFENYNYKEKEIKLPFAMESNNTSIVQVKYYEQKEKQIELNKSTAENIMKVKMYDQLINMCNEDSKILNTSFNIDEDENYYYLSAQIELLEDIGKNVPIFPAEKNDAEGAEEN